MSLVASSDPEDALEPEFQLFPPQLPHLELGVVVPVVVVLGRVPFTIGLGVCAAELPLPGVSPCAEPAVIILSSCGALVDAVGAAAGAVVVVVLGARLLLPHPPIALAPPALLLSSCGALVG